MFPKAKMLIYIKWLNYKDVQYNPYIIRDFKSFKKNAHIYQIWTFFSNLIKLIKIF